MPIKFNCNKIENYFNFPNETLINRNLHLSHQPPDVLELEHVPLDERLSNLLVGPGDEHLVVVVGLLRQPGAEVDGHLQVHALPIRL